MKNEEKDFQTMKFYIYSLEKLEEQKKLILRTKREKKAKDGDSGHVTEGAEGYFKESGLYP